MDVEIIAESDVHCIFDDSYILHVCSNIILLYCTIHHKPC